MPPKRRAQAFSGKKKKEQLQQKRKLSKSAVPSHAELLLSKTEAPVVHQKPEIKEKTSKSEKYKLLFQNESRSELDEAKRRAQNVTIELGKTARELSVADIYSEIIDFPKRPDWKGEKDAKKIDEIEKATFSEFVEKIEDDFGGRNLSFFEHNLETWRQLWRIMELCDVICIVADVRHPVLHFPPALYHHLVAKKIRVLLILSKVDLVAPEQYAAWKKYFSSFYPELRVIGFTCFDAFTFRDNKTFQKRRQRTVKFGNQFSSQIGPLELGETIQRMFPDFDLEKWIKQLKLIAKGEQPDESSFDSDKEFIKIGFVGHTNVGKSSIMNALVGEKHFSMSIRPGHTKELQTWNVSEHVQLVDSPGIIFPSTVSRQLQILSGLFPVDQVREPYSVIGYLAERVNLVAAFHLKHISDELYWTAWDICESFAKKKNFMVAKRAYPDAYRGANFILRMAVSGQLVLAFEPPGYDPADFCNDLEVQKIKALANKEQLTRRDVELENKYSALKTKEETDESSEEQSEKDEDFSVPVNRFAMLSDSDC